MLKDFQTRFSGVVQGKSKMLNLCVRFFEVGRVGQLRQENINEVFLSPHVTRATGGLSQVLFLMATYSPNLRGCICCLPPRILR